MGRECLHGNGYTNMVACVSPTESDLTETLNTLRYANSAKNMKKPSIPRHLLAFSARKRKFEGIDLPKTPGKFLKLNNTIGPKTAFVLHSHRELHGPFTSLAILEEIPGIQKSFFNKFVK